MKRSAKLFFATIFLLTISSCDRKSCTKVVCASYETCYEGQCICPDGYEGTDCQTLSATKYTGNWFVSENCGGGIPPNYTGYSIYIAPIPAGTSGYAANGLTITPLFGVGTFYAQILNLNSGNMGNTIYIPPQNQGSISVAASYGTLYPSSTTGLPATIQITLNYTSNGISYSCLETFTQQ